MLRILQLPPTGGNTAVEFRPEYGTDFVGADGSGHEGFGELFGEIRDSLGLLVNHGGLHLSAADGRAVQAEPAGTFLPDAVSGLRVPMPPTVARPNRATMMACSSLVEITKPVKHTGSIIPPRGHAHSFSGLQRRCIPLPHGLGSASGRPLSIGLSSVRRQGIDELVDFLFGVVEVRAGAETAGADGNHDAVLLLQVPLDPLVVVELGSKRDDAAGVGWVA